MADNDLNKKIEYFDNLKSKREKWHHIWDELKKYVCPQTESNKVIFDSTSIWSREQLASGLALSKKLCKFRKNRSLNFVKPILKFNHQMSHSFIPVWNGHSPL
ncbi:MAG: hypothetical protein DMENIID0002_14010 [Rickettsia endosymbiont of Sergentomyia squamirostris]|uniref:Transposase n=1 Tax=Candidatus Tisiphia endosymbiont of Sergentomyia squamirostris TaxID=3113639 RepID=A0AAT9GAF5_9RICK